MLTKTGVALAISLVSGFIAMTPSASACFIFSGVSYGGLITFDGCAFFVPVTFLSTAPDATVGVAYTATNLLASGTPVIVTANGVPNGMSISANGILSGTPLSAGTYTMNLSGINFVNMVGDGVVTIVVNNPAPDTIAPVITMNGTNISLIAGTVYSDAGATCTDNNDATCTVFTTSTVNTAVAGTYTVTYRATDAAGNIATPVVRTVTVTPAPDTTAPVITMIGTNVYLVAGTVYTDAGATCRDNKDITCVVVTTSTVNTAVAGIYTVTYRSTDAAGNIATPVVRTVTVTPVIKVNEINKIITAISTTTINIGTLVIHITPTTVVKLNNGKPLKVGDSIEYKGIMNTNGSVTATLIKI